MSERYSIGELARAAEVPTSTVRYYERVGMLLPAGRTAGNFRYYGADALDRLRFIRSAQATGFTLGDIKSLLGFRDGDTAPCAEVQTLIESRLADVGKRLGELQHLQDVLQSSLEACRVAERTGRCKVMEKLSSAALTGDPRQYKVRRVENSRQR